MSLARVRLASLACVALLGLAACHKDEPAATPGGETPEKAVQQSLDLLKAGNFGGFWKHALPPADYANLRADWDKAHAQAAPPSDEQRKQFDQTMKEFTEPDAETKLYAQLRPKLNEFKNQYSDQLPVMVGIFQAIGTSAVEQSKTLTQEQKQQVRAILVVLAPWAQKADWFNQGLAKQAVGIAVDTARKLQLPDAQALQKLDFDGAMQRYGVLYQGSAQLLALYGLKLDAVFDSAKLSVEDTDQASARVKLDYTVLDKPLSTEVTLIQQDGRWYDRDLLQQARDAHLQALQPAASGSSEPAPAGSIPAAPAPAGSAVQG